VSERLDTFAGFEEAFDGVPPRVRIQGGPSATPPGAAAQPRETGVEAVFEARDVSVYYGRKRALTGVSLRIPRNRITALIGDAWPLLLRGRGRRLRRALHRVHQHDRVHEGQPRVAAPLTALDAVALVGGQRRSA
jgi:hypothetical protein